MWQALIVMLLVFFCLNMIYSICFWWKGFVQSVLLLHVDWKKQDSAAIFASWLFVGLKALVFHEFAGRILLVLVVSRLLRLLDFSWAFWFCFLLNQRIAIVPSCFLFGDFVAIFLWFLIWKFTIKISPAWRKWMIHPALAWCVWNRTVLPC